MTRRIATLLFPTWIYSCQSVGTVNFALPFTTSKIEVPRDVRNSKVTISISILQTFRSWVATSHLRPPMAFLSHNSSDTPGLFLLWMLYSEGGATCQWASRARICQGAFEIVSKEVLWSTRGSCQTIWGPPLPNVTRHSGWWPHTVTPSIDKTLHQFLTATDLDLITEFAFFLIVQGFHRAYATGFVPFRSLIFDMPTKDAYSSGHLVLSHFGTCLCSNVETNLSWTCLVSRFLSPRNALRWGYSNAAVVPSVRAWFRPSVRGPCEHDRD